MQAIWDHFEASLATLYIKLFGGTLFNRYAHSAGPGLRNCDIGHLRYMRTRGHQTNGAHEAEATIIAYIVNGLEKERKVAVGDIVSS